MPLVFYVNHSGDMYEADTPLGDSAMNGAVANMIDGILGECGAINLNSMYFIVNPNLT